jgi:hypothetical protein
MSCANQFAGEGVYVLVWRSVFAVGDARLGKRREKTWENERWAKINRERVRGWEKKRKKVAQTLGSAGDGPHIQQMG